MSGNQHQGKQRAQADSRFQVEPFAPPQQGPSGNPSGEAGEQHQRFKHKVQRPEEAIGPILNRSGFEVRIKNWSDFLLPTTRGPNSVHGNDRLRQGILQSSFVVNQVNCPRVVEITTITPLKRKRLVRTVVETMFLCADIVKKQARHSGRNVLRLRFGPETERCLIGAMKENSTGLTKGEGALREQ